MSEFANYLVEVFADFGDVTVKRMFGGQGLFHNDLMIGLVANDVLYLKADKESVNAFTDKGLDPFEYVKNGNAIKMSYYLAPEEIFDDPEEAKSWAALAYAAAVRQKKPANKGQSPR